MGNRVSLISETKHFAKLFDKIVGKADRAKLHKYLTSDPQSGVVIKGSGGIRKLRWARVGRGKSGGIHIIYYFYSEGSVLYLLTLFAKSEKDNLSKKDINELAKITAMIKLKHRKMYDC